MLSRTPRPQFYYDRPCIQGSWPICVLWCERSGSICVGQFCFPFELNSLWVRFQWMMFETRLVLLPILHVLVMFSSLVDWYVSKRICVAALMAWVKIVDLSIASEGNCTTLKLFECVLFLLLAYIYQIGKRRLLLCFWNIRMTGHVSFSYWIKNSNDDIFEQSDKFHKKMFMHSSYFCALYSMLFCVQASTPGVNVDFVLKNATCHLLCLEGPLVFSSSHCVTAEFFLNVTRV